MSRRSRSTMATSLFWWRLELAAFVVFLVCVPMGIGMLSGTITDHERRKQVPEDACRKAARESLERVWTEAERQRLLVACTSNAPTTGPTRTRPKVLT